MQQNIRHCHISMPITMDRAKVFMTGRSQAVRLPKAYRFETGEVFIERTRDGILLRPAPSAPLGQRLLAVLGEHDFAWFERAPQGDLERDAAWWAAHGVDPEPAQKTSRKPAKGAASAKKKPALVRTQGRR